MKTETVSKTMKKVLLKMRRDILEGIAGNVKEESNELKTEIGDLYDLASTERDRELSLLLGDREREKLLEIDNALARIEEGTYGVCEMCEKKISVERLKVMPFARLCVSCRAETERSDILHRESEDLRPARDLSFPSDADEEE